MNKTKKFYTAKYDRVFKATLCKEDNNILFKAVLSHALQRNVKEFKFLNPELPIKNIYEKTKTLDVLALVDEEYIHIEINTDIFRDYLNVRNFSYFCDLYSNKIKRGEDYDYKTKFIHIDLSYNIKSKEKFRIYYVMDKNENKYVKNFEIKEINMDYLKEYCYNNLKEFNKYKYLLMLDMNLEELYQVERDSIMEEYKNTIEKLNNDEKFTGLIDSEQDFKMCLNTERKIGFEEGNKIGIEQGIEQTKKNIIINMNDNKFSIDDIMKVTGLDKKEINEIIKNN